MPLFISFGTDVRLRLIFGWYLQTVNLRIAIAERFKPRSSPIEMQVRPHLWIFSPLQCSTTFKINFLFWFFNAATQMSCGVFVFLQPILCSLLCGKNRENTPHFGLFLLISRFLPPENRMFWKNPQKSVAWNLTKPQDAKKRDYAVNLYYDTSSCSVQHWD